ncbi:hypothetical protein QBC38DRAFT_447556 [Podospora fimiseda]|uniref:Uncharacterized protein n=1 Tax=Podospora fimiseda TaxID=252190 RepID=A0AAN7GNP0_9PEZI|nr:hypothetical protein QBC38DRAFT_447556 [Podospora fimiseda]
MHIHPTSAAFLLSLGASFTSAVPAQSAENIVSVESAESNSRGFPDNTSYDPPVFDDTNKVFPSFFNDDDDHNWSGNPRGGSNSRGGSRSGGDRGGSTSRGGGSSDRGGSSSRGGCGGSSSPREILPTSIISHALPYGSQPNKCLSSSFPPNSIQQ